MEVCYDNSKDRSEIMKKTIQVEGMMCQHCEQRVNKALMNVAGVTSCAASAEKGIVDVEFDAQCTNEAAISQAITDTGYDVKGQGNMAEGMPISKCIRAVSLVIYVSKIESYAFL